MTHGSISTNKYGYNGEATVFHLNCFTVLQWHLVGGRCEAAVARGWVHWQQVHATNDSCAEVTIPEDATHLEPNLRSHAILAAAMQVSSHVEIAR